MFCIDNVSVDATENDIKQFVFGNGITVISCFEVKPRRSRYQRLNDIAITDRKSFRLCVPREQVKQLLNPDIWPSSISISSWIFSKKQTNEHPDKNVRTDDHVLPMAEGCSVEKTLIEIRGGSEMQLNSTINDVDLGGLDPDATIIQNNNSLNHGCNSTR